MPSNTQAYAIGAGVGVAGSVTFFTLLVVSTMTLTRKQSKWSRAASIVGIGVGAAGAFYASGLESSFVQANFDAPQVNKAAKDFLEGALSLVIKCNLPLLGYNIETIAKSGFSCAKSVSSYCCPSFFGKVKKEDIELNLMEEGRRGNEKTYLLRQYKK